MKDGIRGEEEDLGLFVAGGKGATSRKTPDEIASWGDRTGIEADPLIYASKTSAKVDSAAVQDGYQIYHHSFLFDREGRWAVIQQGMNEDSGMARRYHWLSTRLDDFVCEPHAAVCCDKRAPSLNLVARASAKTRAVTSELSRERPERIVSELEGLKRLELPQRHAVLISDIAPERLRRIFVKTYEVKPEDFRSLLGIAGVGGKTLRALALVAELVYGSAPSFEDPARYSFAHGGKDGIPYPVDRPLYDNTISTLERAIKRAKLNKTEEIRALRRMERVFGKSSG
ncbi:MAG: DUF763 domain-containing protein [Thermoplasmata archaeon]|nr:MAG: DUF763 domain-containing protein [Thermoplasmata archaeon]